MDATAASEGAQATCFLPRSIMAVFHRIGLRFLCRFAARDGELYFSVISLHFLRTGKTLTPPSAGFAPCPDEAPEPISAARLSSTGQLAQVDPLNLPLPAWCASPSPERLRLASWSRQREAGWAHQAPIRKKAAAR